MMLLLVKNGTSLTPGSSGAAARHMTRASARDQRLGGNAAGVDAGAAELLALDDRSLQAFLVEARAERRRRLADTDDDRIEALGHGFFLKTSRRLFAGMALSSSSSQASENRFIMQLDDAARK